MRLKRHIQRLTGCCISSGTLFFKRRRRPTPQELRKKSSHFRVQSNLSPAARGNADSPHVVFHDRRGYGAERAAHCHQNEEARPAEHTMTVPSGSTSRISDVIRGPPRFPPFDADFSSGLHRQRRKPAHRPETFLLKRPLCEQISLSVIYVRIDKPPGSREARLSSTAGILKHIIGTGFAKSEQTIKRRLD